MAWKTLQHNNTYYECRNFSPAAVILDMFHNLYTSPLCEYLILYLVQGVRSDNRQDMPRWEKIATTAQCSLVQWYQGFNPMSESQKRMSSYRGARKRLRRPLDENPTLTPIVP